MVQLLPNRPLPAHGALGLSGRKLGEPLNIAQVARLIGCSTWTVRQTLIPKGLPHFRFTALGRLIFYEDQVVRWIESAQGG
jgi:hypothetical protein